MHGKTRTLGICRGALHTSLVLLLLSVAGSARALRVALTATFELKARKSAKCFSCRDWSINVPQAVPSRNAANRWTTHKYVYPFRHQLSPKQPFSTKEPKFQACDN